MSISRKTATSRAIILGVLCMLVCACAPRADEHNAPHVAQQAAAKPTAPPADAKQSLSNAGAYLVSYVTEPSPIPLNEAFAIRFWVEPMMADHSAVDELEVAVDARMPEHHHGMYRQPKVKSLGDGAFEATGMLFHMPGYWELYFDITHAGVTERAQFPIEID